MLIVIRLSLRLCFGILQPLMLHYLTDNNISLPNAAFLPSSLRFVDFSNNDGCNFCEELRVEGISRLREYFFRLEQGPVNGRIDLSGLRLSAIPLDLLKECEVEELIMDRNFVSLLPPTITVLKRSESFVGTERWNNTRFALFVSLFP